MVRPLFAAVLSACLLTPSARAADDDHAKAKAVIEKAIKAAGWDKDSPTAVHTWKGKGKFSGGGMSADFTGDWAFAGPDKYRFAVNLMLGEQKFDFLVIANGEKVQESGFGMTQLAAGEKLEYVLGSVHQMRVQTLVSLLADKEFHLKPLPEVKIGDAPAVGVEVTRKGKPTVNLYFDAKTGLLAKSAMTVKNEFDGWKEVLDEAFVSGWKDADGGRKVFTTLKVVRGGQTMLESELSDYKVTDKLDAKLFEIADKK